MKRTIIAMLAATVMLVSCPTMVPAAGYSSARSYTPTTTTRSYSSTSQMRSSSVPSSTRSVPRSYSSSRNYGYSNGTSNMLITGAVLYAVLASDDSDASAEQKEAVAEQYKFCVSETGYEGQQSDAAALLKTDKDLSETQQEMKDCMLPDNSTGMGIVWVVLCIVSIGVVAIIGALALI